MAMPRQPTPLMSEQADLHVLVARSVRDSERELRQILRITAFPETGEQRRPGVLRVWVTRVAVAAAVVAVIAIYTLTVLQLQMPMSADPFG
jgi:hypothetical protein